MSLNQIVSTVLAVFLYIVFLGLITVTIKWESLSSDGKRKIAHTIRIESWIKYI